MSADHEKTGGGGEEEGGPGGLGAVHAFTWTTLRHPATCAACRRFLIALNRQFLRCQDCSILVHEGCADRAQSSVGCKVHAAVPRPRLPSPKSLVADPTACSSPRVLEPKSMRAILTSVSTSSTSAESFVDTSPVQALKWEPETESANVQDSRLHILGVGESSSSLQSAALGAQQRISCSLSSLTLNRKASSKRETPPVKSLSVDGWRQTCELKEVYAEECDVYLREEKLRGPVGQAAPKAHLDGTENAIKEQQKVDTLDLVQGCKGRQKAEEEFKEDLDEEEETKSLCQVEEDQRSRPEQKTSSRADNELKSSEEIYAHQGGRANHALVKANDNEEEEGTDVDEEEEGLMGEAREEEEDYELTENTIGRVQVQIMETRQIGRDGSRPILEPELSKAMGYSMSLGETWHYSPRLEGLEKENAFKTRERGESTTSVHSKKTPEKIDENAKKQLKRSPLSPQQQVKTQEKAVWEYEKPYVFELTDLASDFELVIYKPARAMSFASYYVLGQVNVPILHLLESFEQWFEIYPRPGKSQKCRVRPAVPIIDKSGLDFPKVSLGYVKLRFTTTLFIDQRSLWKLYLNPLRPGEANDSIRNAYRPAKMKDTLGALVEIRRNAVRIRIVRSYWYRHFIHAPCAFFDGVRSWKQPWVSLSFWFVAFAFFFILPTWSMPVVFTMCSTAISRFYFSGHDLCMNWETVRKIPTKRVALPETEEDKQGTKLQAPLPSSQHPPNAFYAAKAHMENVFFTRRKWSAGSNASSVQVAVTQCEDTVCLTDAEEEEDDENFIDDVHQEKEDGCGERMRDKRPSRKQQGGSCVDRLPLDTEQQRVLHSDSVDTDVGSVQSGSSTSPRRSSVSSFFFQNADDAPSEISIPLSGHLYNRPEDIVFPREPMSEDFFVWNHQIDDPKRGLNLIEKTALVWREIRWVQELTGDIADAGEKLALCLSRANSFASDAIEIILLVLGLSFSGCCLLYSCFPFASRTSLYIGLLLLTSPPILRDTLQQKILNSSTEAPSTESILKVIWQRMVALWSRLVTIDDVGHQFVCSTQRVSFAPHLETRAFPIPPPRTNTSSFSTESFSRILRNRKQASSLQQSIAC